MLQKNNFIEVGKKQISKKGEAAFGDTILSRKSRDNSRVVTVLSDGLGSGIKASVLSSLTATMALKTIENGISDVKVAETICATLPVCSIRKISYATFTIVDIYDQNKVKIIEYDNPEYIHLRGNKTVKWTKDVKKFVSSTESRNELMFSNFDAVGGDRIIFFSDGVTQSGLGCKGYPLGLGGEIDEIIESKVMDNPNISASDLADFIVKRALINDLYAPKDDISCVVIYFREPRLALLATGPPTDPNKDLEFSLRVRDFKGSKIICGGSTANLVARELGITIGVKQRYIDDSMPPMAKMDGIDILSEGIITLGKVSEYLEHGIPVNTHYLNPALTIVNKLLEIDKITFLVGTKINDAHQDPSMPVELEIRRNIIKKISSHLTEKYLKESEVIYI